MVLGLSIAGTVLISMAVFLLVMILLVVVLLYARKKLTPQGDITLRINDREMVVSPGSSLLSTMSNKGIFLPSAC
ncbi:NADH:ubiquinone reductase (Na(+)-transporting) subunit F, partial [bacterium]|nr:NADH:ubiquinone reductase (Na(+)-transporting) subunit F [bacterium]